jgi:hypothetical protein
MSQHSLKILIAVKTCNAHADKANLQRKLWAQCVKDADVKFFLGRGATRDQLSDEVFLNCGDGYDDLTDKARAVFYWACERGYDYIFYVDDDVYVRVERLLASDFADYDYVGRLSTISGIYASGGPGIWLSRRALEILVREPVTDTVDDRWVGNTLAKNGIRLHHDVRYCVSRNWERYKDSFISCCSEREVPINLALLHKANV